MADGGVSREYVDRAVEDAFEAAKQEVYVGIRSDIVAVAVDALAHGHPKTAGWLTLLVSKIEKRIEGYDDDDAGGGE